MKRKNPQIQDLYAQLLKIIDSRT